MKIFDEINSICYFKHMTIIVSFLDFIWQGEEQENALLGRSGKEEGEKSWHFPKLVVN